MATPASLTTTTTTIANITRTTTNTTTTTDPYDAEGAMKFTVAVVLVFGIGVIGLLGIYHRRNISEDLSDKEADEFVKRFERKRCDMDKQYRKRLMLNVVASLFSTTWRAQAQDKRYRKGPTLRQTLSEPNLFQVRSLLGDWRPESGGERQAGPTQDTDQTPRPSQTTRPDVKLKRQRPQSFQMPSNRGMKGSSALQQSHSCGKDLFQKMLPVKAEPTRPVHSTADEKVAASRVQHGVMADGRHAQRHQNAPRGGSGIGGAGGGGQTAASTDTQGMVIPTIVVEDWCVTTDDSDNLSQKSLSLQQDDSGNTCATRDVQHNRAIFIL